MPGVQAFVTRGYVLESCHHQFKRAVAFRMKLIVPLLPDGIANQDGVAASQGFGHAHVIRVIRHHQKIQRARKLRRHANVGNDFFPAREPECIFRAQARSEQPCVEGVTGVEMGISPQQAARPDVGQRRRIWPAILRCRRFGGDFSSQQVRGPGR
jgi:hypothetical protein